MSLAQLEGLEETLRDFAAAEALHAATCRSCIEDRANEILAAALARVASHAPPVDEAGNPAGPAPQKTAPASRRDRFPRSTKAAT